MVYTNLKLIRERRGIGATELAAQAGVARQTIYAIEAGTFVPNTSVALQLARALEVSVEELFQLETEAADHQSQEAELLHDEPVSATEGMPVRLGRVGSRLIAAPVQVNPGWLAGANGVIAARRSGTSVLARLAPGGSSPEQTILIAGCDPAVSVLSRFLLKGDGADVASIECSSSRALSLLKAGKVHIAGMHLRDAGSGEFNLPFIRSVFPHGGFQVVTYATWEQGFVVAPGNPRGIYSVADLVRRGIKIINRAAGSGSRDLLDRILGSAGIETSRVRGYERTAAGHLSAAQTVCTGQADCCVATRIAATTLGLDFIPLAEERYDFVTMRRHASEAPVTALFDALNRSAFRRQLAGIAGYGTTQTGAIPS